MSPSAIALWFALMDTANRAGWPRDFSIAISTLRSKTRYGKDAIYAARNQLKQKGRIDFRERKGNLSTVYQIISFASDYQTQQPPYTGRVSEYQTQIPTQHPTQLPTQYPTQLPNNNKLNKTKLFCDGDADDARACAEEITPSWLFVQYFGREPVPAEERQCAMWLDMRNADIVEHAFNQACLADVKNLAYVRGILENFRGRGVEDMGDVAEDDMRRTARR